MDKISNKKQEQQVEMMEENLDEIVESDRAEKKHNTKEIAMSQNTIIKLAMIRLMKDGLTSKDDIYDHCEKVLNYPRPTVRRVGGILRKELELQLTILSSDIGKNGTS